uniref:Uncharacterized protein n=1 Tax=Anopheles farauti TaxID=69004 RepID=A0A182QJ98_9DIPT
MLKLSVALLFVAVHLARANLAAESTVTSGKLINAPPPPPTTSLGSLYRTARDDYNSRRHCSNCGPGYERDMRSYARPTGITGYYSGMGAIEDDRNWYYRPESFDDRYRGSGGGYQSAYGGGYRQPAYMGYEYDRYMQRPDDRGYGGYGYQGMAMRTNYYDGGASRMPYYPDMMRGYGYRGNGYDNLDPHYEYYMTQRGPMGMSSRDRYYGQQGYYDDRMMGYGGHYDNKNFRPWDQTYRGISGFDNSGRGYYFASRPSTSSSPSSQPPSAPSSSHLSAHASYHVQSQGPASASGYGGSQPGGAEHPGRPTGGSYQRPEQQHHNGPDRPDYSAPDGTQNCCRNRYPEPAGTHGGSYSAHSSNQGPSAVSYGGGGHVQRPSGSGAGSWSYAGGGGSSTGGGASTGYVGVNVNSHGSYGEPHSGPGQYPGGGGSSSNSGTPAHEYGDNRRETDHRQQSAAYGGRPRPGSLGDTSYLMDRDTSQSDRVSSDPDHERAADDDGDNDTRAKSDRIPSTVSADEQKDKTGNAHSAESDMERNDGNA